MKVLTLSVLLLCIGKKALNAIKLPGSLVYVVTPSPRKLTIDQERSAPHPFYYHNWIRRMDTIENTTIPETTTPVTTTTRSIKTPDLIFAEFESDKMKNIRRLLEKERINVVTTTMEPIYVPDEAVKETQKLNNGLPVQTTERTETISEKDKTDYFALYNNMYNSKDHLPGPVFGQISSTFTTQKPTTSTTKEAPAAVNSIENIWHIIDSEKHNQYSIGWEEVPTNAENLEEQNGTPQENYEKAGEQKGHQANDDDVSDQLDENFALPGFSTNPTKGAENESRAIRTEPNIRFPYVNLKPFQMKNLKKPVMNTLVNNKNENSNPMTSLDNFFDIKNPVRGEAQDVVHMRQQIDRYNPAQPYLPSLPSEYGSKSKQSSPSSPPVKAVANLVPPPPPLPPKISADDFPSPVTYDSFPPYAPSAPNSAAPPQPPALSNNTVSMSSPNTDTNDSFDSGPPDVMDLGYRYKPPASTGQSFFPTISPPSKPFGGYSYNKPSMTAYKSPQTEEEDTLDFKGYHYKKPESSMPAKPDFQGYHYNKPEPPVPSMDIPPVYDHGPPTHEHDYPELIFDKPHGGKGGDDAKGDDMGMMPPPPSPDTMKPNGPPTDDSGFPHDFPGDFKFHHDFDDDHDFYHHHHHHTTTTTTTTTEMPRVNRYSYYYLGKKLYYLPLYFSVYFIIYVGALIIKAVLRHKIVYPNSYRPNSDTASVFNRRSIDSWDLSNENLHEITGKVTHAIASVAERYMKNDKTRNE